MPLYRRLGDRALDAVRENPYLLSAPDLGVDFAAAGWANDIPEIEGFMRANCERYFKRVEDFGKWLFDE
jgi:hypothetical protein